jgi:thioredoxin 1
MNNSFDNLIKSEKPVLIDFHATWCGPCKVLGTHFKLKDNLGDRISIIKIDVDKTNSISVSGARFSIDSFQEGKQLARIRCLEKCHIKSYGRNDNKKVILTGTGILVGLCRICILPLCRLCLRNLCYLCEAPLYGV